MLKPFKILLKYSLLLLLSIMGYLLFSVLLSCITVNKSPSILKSSNVIYLHSNGVHLSVILPLKSMSENLKKDLVLPIQHDYAKFGWGDENFYLKVPKWKDFKIEYALGALFLDNPTAIHITTYQTKRKNWVAIKISDKELIKMNKYLLHSFKVNEEGKKNMIPQKLYKNNDTFYKANGTYSPIKTCNTWVNNGFKESGLKASLWTLFDFGLLNKYKND